MNAQTACQAGADLERLPSLSRACDVHDSTSAKYIVGIPDLDSIEAHHLGVLQGNLLHLAPIPIDEQGIPNIIWVHHKEEDHALIHVAQGVAKDEDKSQEDRGEAEPHFVDVHLQQHVTAFSSDTIGIQVKLCQWVMQVVMMQRSLSKVNC